MTRPGPVELVASGEVLRQAIGRLRVRTEGTGFVDLTERVAGFVAGSGIRHGLAVVFCRHTSASLLIGENADPDVGRDLADALDRLAPRDAGYIHAAEGPDDMPAHIRSMLTGASLAIPVISGRLALGTWQGVFLAEHRDRPHHREIVLQVSGGSAE